MKLYTYFQSSASYRVRIALNLKGLKTEMEFINLVKGEYKSEAYKAVTPQYALPTFIDGDHTLSQSLAIIEYIEETHPAPPLLPKAPAERAYVRSLSQLIACDTSPLGNLGVRKYLTDTLGQSQEAAKEWIGYWIAQGLAAFERTLAHEKYKGTFCHGDTPGMADCCLIPQLYNADRWGVDLAPYPLIRAIRTACDAHPAFLAAHPKQQPDAA